MEALETRQNKLKIIKHNLSKLTNKPQITKADFVAKGRAKVNSLKASKILQLSQELREHYTKTYAI